MISRALVAIVSAAGAVAVLHLGRRRRRRRHQLITAAGGVTGGVDAAAPHLAREASEEVTARCVAPFRIGVCAMAKKANSQPMSEILDRLTSFIANGEPEFQVTIFPEPTILHAPIEDWPECDALIAFFSKGFPLEKAQAYANLRKPYVFNDLHRQEWLLDRREVYRILKENKVPVPNYVVLDGKELAAGKVSIDEGDDYIEIGPVNREPVKLMKPVVEKPISGEDHNIYIYYPRSSGGGSKRLFRKARQPPRPPSLLHPTSM